eukprot:CFRG6934T1
MAKDSLSAAVEIASIPHSPVDIQMDSDTYIVTRAGHDSTHIQTCTGTYLDVSESTTHSDNNVDDKVKEERDDNTNDELDINDIESEEENNKVVTKDVFLVSETRANESAEIVDNGCLESNAHMTAESFKISRENGLVNEDERVSVVNKTGTGIQNEVGHTRMSEQLRDTDAQPLQRPSTPGTSVSSPTLQVNDSTVDIDGVHNTNNIDEKTQTLHVYSFDGVSKVVNDAIGNSSGAVNDSRGTDSVVNEDAEAPDRSGDHTPMLLQKHARSSSYAALSTRVALEKDRRKLSHTVTRESAIGNGKNLKNSSTVSPKRFKPKTTLCWSGFNESITDNDLNVDLTVRSTAVRTPPISSPSPTLGDSSDAEEVSKTVPLILSELEELSSDKLGRIINSLEENLAALNVELVHVLNERDTIIATHEKIEEEMANAMSIINDLTEYQSMEAMTTHKK